MNLHCRDAHSPSTVDDSYILVTGSMDVLSDILDHLRLRGTLYFSTDFAKPWGVQVPAFRNVARFHMVARGSCWIGVGDGERVRLEPGDLALIPHGHAHVLADDRSTPARALDEVVEVAGFSGSGTLVYGGDDDSSAPARLVCGHFEFDERYHHPILRRLPDLILIRWAEHLERGSVETLIRAITEEVFAARPGYEAVVRRLSEVLFVRAVQAWAQRDDPAGILSAFADPRLAPALEAIHSDPGGRWTLETLARKAALGRSAFASRFRDAVGLTPHSYVTLWRMQSARRLLTESHLTLEQIAMQTGYDSAASFSRAFRKETGQAPGAYRRALAG